MLRSFKATLMRGGTSKGLFIHRDELPADADRRNQVLLAAMGSPDKRQINGVGGAHPLTSKVAVVSASEEDGIDVEYLFLQVVVDKPEVSDGQNCGNMLAGVGPWAIENGLVTAVEGTTPVTIKMVNTGSVATAHVPVKDGQVVYEGDCFISGVPTPAAPIPIDFADVAGASCGALLPTGNVIDTFEGVEVTCIDNGMPVVVLRAEDFGLEGTESPAELEANDALRQKVEAIRLKAGVAMNLGDVTHATVPKMSLVSRPQQGGFLNSRTFIPHRVHDAIGVLGAVSVASAAVIEGSVAWPLADQSKVGAGGLDIEHPTGFFSVDVDIRRTDTGYEARKSALIRTAMKLMQGEVFVPAHLFGDTV
ncbi:4-oxalomesaconate tautomerase [Kordiimonas marina]|uniref:4-oxalomesaconate tautomerase n=1 Tax=Kordiimonas marina TaxID=2872312 RepID=UPI001FF58EDF|nr:4-oxalomesaconate tautomerase [Kordiimonas marina]MCJ9427762.1 4-oxalomesaconate tautomerase [Kordiimonas marina]